jgi:glycolate oxidase FAD binding subunit
MKRASIQIDDSAPMPLLQAATPAEVGDFVRQAAAAGQAVYPIGGQTMMGMGLPPQRQGVAIHTGKLAGITDYPARDMTITVQAGITIAELQQVLAGQGQRLPVDVPHPERATLGGTLATNASGPRRYGWGTLRDYVIGISTVNDEGQQVKAGGRVVKNVAGYDLCKLHIGALGTLGVITEVTLKVRPLPESQALITFACDDGQLVHLLDLLHDSRTRPACIELLNRAAQSATQWDRVRLPLAPWVIAVGLEESEAAVQWQVSQLIKELLPADVRGLEVRAGNAALALWDALVSLVDPPCQQLSFKANLPPRLVGEFCLAAGLQAPGAMILHAHAGSGIVRGHVSDWTLDQVRAVLAALGGQAVAAAGNVILTRCPVAWKKELPVWGTPRGDLALMRRVKEQLDPGRRFNPGRFVGGI